MVEARELVSMPNVRAFASASQVPLLFSIRIRHPGSICEPGGALAIVQLGEPLGDVPFSERINEHHPLSTNGCSVCAGSGRVLSIPCQLATNAETLSSAACHFGTGARFILDRTKDLSREEALILHNLAGLWRLEMTLHSMFASSRNP